MCLSDAFELVGGEKKPLMSYVSGISVEDGKVTLTDMLGARKTVSGHAQERGPHEKRHPHRRERMSAQRKSRLV